LHALIVGDDDKSQIATADWHVAGKHAHHGMTMRSSNVRSSARSSAAGAHRRRQIRARSGTIATMGIEQIGEWGDGALQRGTTSKRSKRPLAIRSRTSFVTC